MQKSVKWTAVRVNDLIHNLLEHTSNKDIKGLKNYIIPDTVWLEIENSTGIDKKDLKNFWYLQLHLQLFCPDIVYLNDVKIELIE